MRAAMNSQVRRVFSIRPALGRWPVLRRRRREENAFGRWRDSDDALDKEAGRVDLVGVERTNRHHFFRLDDRTMGGGGHDRIEIALGSAKHEVPESVGLPGANKSVVGRDRLLQYKSAAFELAVLLPRGDLGADPRWSVESRNSRAARPDALGQCPLGHRLGLELARR